MAKQCSLANARSDLPTTSTNKVYESLSTVCIIGNDILKNIKNPNKAHGHMIGVQMVKLYNVSLCKSLELILRSFPESGKFPL